MSKKKQNNIKSIFYKILDDYGENIMFHIIPDGEMQYCYPKQRAIFISAKEFVKPTRQSVFDVLHEIGHLETHKDSQKSFECEYYSTVWAIDAAKRYGLEIPQYRKVDFQNYIFEKIDLSIKCGLKRKVNKADYIFKW